MLSGNFDLQSRRAPWIESFSIDDADAPHDPIDLNAAVTAASARICKPGSDTAILEKTWGAGVSSPALGTLLWRFEATELATLSPGTWRFLLVLTAGGELVEVLDAVLPLT